MRVFRYFDSCGALKTLEEKAFRLSDPRQCNDPFEFMPNTGPGLTVEQLQDTHCTPPMIKLFHEQWGSFEGLSPQQSETVYRTVHLPSLAPLLVHEMKNVEALHRISLADAIAAEVRILCCSHTHESILMWSHYAQKHQGVVIEFEADEIGSSEPSIRDILYRTRSPESSLDISRLSSTKAVEWSYEEEVRLQYHLLDVCERSGHCFVNFDPGCIKRVILGCRYNLNHPDAIGLTVILSDPVYAHVEVQHARQLGADYKIRFEKCDLLANLMDQNIDVRSAFDEPSHTCPGDESIAI